MTCSYCCYLPICITKRLNLTFKTKKRRKNKEFVYKSGGNCSFDCFFLLISHTNWYFLLCIIQGASAHCLFFVVLMFCFVFVFHFNFIYYYYYYYFFFFFFFFFVVVCFCFLVFVFFLCVIFSHLFFLLLMRKASHENFAHCLVPAK